MINRAGSRQCTGRGGGSNWARGQGGRLGPLVGPGQKPWWGVLGGGGRKPPDGKRFSVFEMPLEGSPL